MALNPVMTPAGEIWRMPGEYLILRRPLCKFEVKIDGLGLFKGSGSVCAAKHQPIGDPHLIPSRPS